jgi:hypothetical protein
LDRGDVDDRGAFTKNAGAGARGGRSKKAGRAIPSAAGSAAATRRPSPLRHCSLGEAEALTRRAVELALVGDPTALRLCIERILPRCREHTVKFVLPPIESAADIAPAMKSSPPHSPRA